MSVTANQLIQAMDPGKLIPAPVAGTTTLYQGTLAFWERTSGAGEGFALGDDDSGNNNFAGIVVDKVDNSAGSAGDKKAELYTEGSFVLEGAGFTQAMVGDKIYATDNYTVTNVDTNATYIGTCVEYISATKIRVKLDVQTP